MAFDCINRSRGDKMCCKFCLCQDLVSMCFQTAASHVSSQKDTKNTFNREKQVYAWGRGEHGRLGFGDDKSSRMVPQKVHLLAGEDIVQVSCGGTHSVARTRDGRMFSFGRGDHGRLGYGRKVTTGHPMEVPINIPAPISLSSLGKHWCATSVACGGRHTLAIALWVDKPEQLAHHTSMCSQGNI